MKEAINEMAGIVQKGEQQRMATDFDRPTPFTVNALKINYATKTKLSGGVVFKEPARLSESQHYLYPNVFGVQRGFKKFEGALYAQGLIPPGHVAIPGKGLALDAYGNVPSSLYNQILSWFGANKKPTTTAVKEKKKRGTRKTYGFEYVAIIKKTGGLIPGIYKRSFTPFGTATSTMFIYVQQSKASYTQKYKFHETGKKIFNQYFKLTFDQKLDLAMRTALK
jgi:hypothetical protein